MSRIKLDGIFVPHITPFNEREELDEEALRRCVRFWMQGEVSGLVSCGSNGEAPYLSRDERRRVISVVLDEVDGQTPVIAGTGSISTRETIQLTRDAKDLGVDAALVVTPFYFTPSNRELYEHYRAILEAVDLPIILYSVPKFTSFHLDLSVIVRLASEYENVVGVKDSGDNIGRITSTIRMVSDKISVLAGTTDVTLPTLMQGGRGAVIAIANIFPKTCSDLYKAYKQGDYEQASRLQHYLSHYNDVLIKRYNQLAALKEALNLNGLPAGYPRKPTLPLTREEKRELKKMLKPVKGFPYEHV
ncbi:MAG: 4-hydroxy-tetrahydrodipicolinate synthase [Candidatus Bathyarchaeia archaeon]